MGGSALGDGSPDILRCGFLSRHRHMPLRSYKMRSDMNYDAWKLMSPDDENPRCEFCGASDKQSSRGWQPNNCSGECGVRWRDPDAEYDAKRDEQ